ncbi:class I SAM-dependent methyltransferase [Arthrobacter sp. H35-D1]|uniref:class I SAM-dependent methyltransferase n=1 Tax=Arthrobacter sp. H35-D1 TaxID=3046202 RepID=UPI0024B9B493|nr:class I SAM-dependent methyltransferase [Arthrobacter sp. H35-D1]MDJ0314983.1 class I SAM-dependent methyltransferase [Arthrobacter sp. H35-D1]
MSAEWIQEYLQPGRRLVDVGAGVLSAVEPDARGSRYDRQARSYDLAIGNRLYTRLVWSASTTFYAPFAQASVAQSERPLILVDRSAGMLARAAKRLAGADTEQMALVQADLFDLPFKPGSFETVSCHGLLHRIGQSATPRRNEELATLARTALGDSIELRREGSMAYLRSH